MAATKKKRTHVFIDTSAFLSFFAFTNDDIDQLRKLKQAIEGGRLVLHLPQQVIDEFNRNRENKINEALGAFEKMSEIKSGAYPRLLASYPGTKDYSKALQAFQKVRKELIDSAKKDAEAKELSADQLFEELRSAAKVYKTADEILQRAARRAQLRNPPGKDDGSLGDKINWECLLENVPDKADLHIVTKDGDYSSPLHDRRALQFLIDEWEERKGGKLYLHSEVRIFFKQLLEIQFESLRQEKNAALEGLVASRSFAATHAGVEALTPYLDILDNEDVLALAEAAVDNGQIGWIAKDEDVRSFYLKVLAGRFDVLPPKLQKTILELFDLSEQDLEEDEEDPGSSPGVPPH